MQERMYSEIEIEVAFYEGMNGDLVNNLKINNMEQDYTVIYAEYFMIGSCNNYITKIIFITCTKENLISEIEKTVDFGAVLYIFDGICKNTE